MLTRTPIFLMLATMEESSLREVSGGQGRRGRRPSCRDFGGVHERQHTAPLGIEHGDESLNRGQAPGNAIAGKIAVDLDHRYRARAPP